MRRKRPPRAVASCCAWRRCGALVARRRRCCALDFVGVFAGDPHRAVLKAAVRDGAWDLGAVAATRRRSTVAFAYLVTRAAVRALGPVRRRAPSGPGLPRIVASLFQVMVVALLFAVANGERVLELLHLLRLAVLRRSSTSSSLRCALRAGRPGCCCARPATSRRAVLVGTGQHIEASRHALSDARARAGRGRRLHLADPAARQRPALARRARRARRRSSTEHRVDEVIIADPDFPEEQAVELVDQCHQRGVTRAHRAVDDGDPRPPRRVRARRSRCRCSSCARRSSRASTTLLKRTFDLVGALLLLRRAQPAAAA